jgi:hypothetical protein
MQKIAGPTTEEAARKQALTLGESEGVDVWLEELPNSGTYSLLSD